jgi:hypothetical protein
MRVGVPEPGRPPVRQGARPPYQPWAAKKVLEAYNRRNIDDPVARCIPELDLGAGALYPNQFVQTPKVIVILVESRHVFRIIPLNEKHPEDLDPSYLGDSVGRWEGDTLVVDVTGFKERLVGSKISTDALHIVERFTRVDYNTINYEARVDDPKALTKPSPSRASTCCARGLACRNSSVKTIRIRKRLSSSIRKASSRGKIRAADPF